MSQTHTFSTVLTPGETGPSFTVKGRQSLAYTVTGTIDAGCSLVLERSLNSHTWDVVQTWPAAADYADSLTLTYDQDARFRFRAIVDATDPASTLTSLVVSLDDVVETFQSFKNPDGGIVLSLTDEGISTPKATATVVSTDTISEQTAAAGVTIDGLKIKDSQPYCDTIAEKTAATGVTVDGVLLKDGGVTARPAATQDAIIVKGRAGGTTSLAVTITPTTLTASRTLTAPDATGTIARTQDFLTLVPDAGGAWPTAIPTAAQLGAILGIVSEASDSYRMIGAGYHTGATYVPCVWGYKQTSLGGFTQGKFVIALRTDNTDSAPVSALEVLPGGDLAMAGKPGFNGSAPFAKPTVNADCTDLATAVALVNQIRAALISYGLAA